MSTTASNNNAASSPTNYASSPECMSENGKKVPSNVERMFETFHQTANGEFKPTFYNPFEVKHRRRTTKAQFKILERAFLENQKPPANVRRSLASKLGMTPRAVQVWFQNRRAKLKSTGVASLSGSACASPDLSRSNSSSDLSLASHIATPNSNHNLCGNTNGGVATLVLEGRGRANSCPNIDLPFKQLHEALFPTGSQAPSSIPSISSISQSQQAPQLHHQQQQQTMRPRSGSAMPMMYPRYPQYPTTTQQQGFVATPFSAGVYLPPSATMVPFVYPHDLLYVPHHHHTQFYTHGNPQVPIDPSLLINGSGGGSCEEGPDEDDKGLDLDYFSSPKPNDIVIEDEIQQQQHLHHHQLHQQQQQSVVKGLMMEPIDLNGMMMGNSEAFLMSLVDDHHLMP